MTVEEIFHNTTKQEVFDKSIEYWNSGKTKEWLDLKIDLVIGKREGYYFWDMDGKKLMDVHINGGTYSLGHRNPEVVEALIEATGSVDIGNHHFPSPLKAKLAETVVKASAEGMRHVIYGSGGERLLTSHSNAPGRLREEPKLSVLRIAIMDIQGLRSSRSRSVLQIVSRGAPGICESSVQ